MVERRCTFCGDTESSEKESVWLQAPPQHTGVFTVFICENCVKKAASVIEAHYSGELNASV